MDVVRGCYVYMVCSVERQNSTLKEECARRTEVLQEPVFMRFPG